MELKDWNYEKIYSSEMVYKNQKIIEKLFYDIFNCYLEKVKIVLSKEKGLSESEINFKDFILQHEKDTDIKRLIIDYISGQTDKYFLNECKEHLKINNIEDLFK